jgi:hypothetical protein
MKLSFTVAIALGIVLSGVSPAHAETDPFPGVEHMGEVPGTRISSPAWSQQAQWESTDTYQNYLALGCPEGSGRAIAVDVAVMVWSNYCVKTWRSQAVIGAWEKYYSDEAEGRATAYEQSLAWNKANPGKQKCFPYGPLTSPDGGTTSGGVCANAVSPDSPITPNPTDFSQNPITEESQTQLPTQNPITEESQTQLPTQNGAGYIENPVAANEPIGAGNGTLQLVETEGLFPTITVRLLASLPRG